MSLNSRVFGLAAGLTAGLLFVLCAAAVAVAPGPTTAFFGYLFHADLRSLPLTLTWGSLAGGLFAWTVGTAVTFGFGAWLYNRLVAWSLPVETTGPAPVQPGLQHPIMP